MKAEGSNYDPQLKMEISMMITLQTVSIGKFSICNIYALCLKISMP